MKKFYISILSIFLIISAIAFGCSNYKKENTYNNISSIQSGTIANIPSNLIILIKKPQPYEYQIIRDCLWQFHVYELEKGQSGVIRILIDNSFVGDIKIVGNQIVISPHQGGFISFDLYHYLCRLNKKNCKRIFCGEQPKPCDNED